MPAQIKEYQQDARRGAYTDKHGVAAYLGVSSWQVDELVRQGVLPPGVALIPGGKRIWPYRDLDAAYERAKRSRRPRREPRGIVRMRMEANRRGRTAGDD